MTLAKERVVTLIEAGKRVSDAMPIVGRSVKTYEAWRRDDKDFAKRIDLVRELMGTDYGEKRRRALNMDDFGAWRNRYLGMRTFSHQQQWIDVIEGREPEGLHAAMTFERGDPSYVLINTAPEHSKTITLSVDYPTYRICRDPNVRILLVSETQKRAKEFLYAIKQRLTHPRYGDLQLAFAPPDGFKASADAWRDEYVYLGGDGRDSGEKDPTVQALGIGGQIYGARADLIILDDCVVLSNAHQWEGQIRWIQQEVLTRLGPGGKLIIAGTRVDAVDLYREIRNPDRYPEGSSPWTYLAQPAVLEFADEPADWVTLWPRSNVPWPGSGDEPDGDGLFPRWDGRHLYRRRGVLDPKTWSMVYMQQDVSSEAVFDPYTVRKCVNGNRTAGVMQKGNQYHRGGDGMDNLYVICSMDPAMAGDTATVAYGLDLRSMKRYVLDAHRMTAPTPQKIRDVIHGFTERYKPQSWVIEKNAFQLFLTKDEEIRSYLAARGVTMREHYTSNNKLDPDFGVASVAPLFSTDMIELPSTHNHEGMKALVEQLVIWSPGQKKEIKSDLPMALWFAEIIAREIVETRMFRTQRHRASRFVPRYAAARQNVISLNDYRGDEYEGDVRVLSPL